MAATLEVDLSSPEHTPVTYAATEVVAPGAGGEFTVLPGHTPMATVLTHGLVVVDPEDGERQFYAVHGGFAEVLDDRVVILADGLEHADSIDAARAEAAQERALARIRKPDDDTAIPRAEAALARARARIRAHQRDL